MKTQDDGRWPIGADKVDRRRSQIYYGLAMRKASVSSYVINLNGAFRTSRDLEAPAYDAANRLKKKHPAETVTIIKPDGTLVRILEDGRTA